MLLSNCKWCQFTIFWLLVNITQGDLHASEEIWNTIKSSCSVSVITFSQNFFGEKMSPPSLYILKKHIWHKRDIKSPIAKGKTVSDLTCNAASTSPIPLNKILSPIMSTFLSKIKTTLGKMPTIYLELQWNSLLNVRNDTTLWPLFVTNMLWWNSSAYCQWKILCANYKASHLKPIKNIVTMTKIFNLAVIPFKYVNIWRHLTRLLLWQCGTVSNFSNFTIQCWHFFWKIYGQVQQK